MGKREGARLLTGGTRVADGALARGYFYAPTIFDNVRPGMRIEQEEIFGPVTDLIDADSLGQGGGGPPAVRRHQEHRQRPPGGRDAGPGRLQRVEGRLHRLQRAAAAGADRPGVDEPVRRLASTAAPLAGVCLALW